MRAHWSGAQDHEMNRASWAALAFVAAGLCWVVALPMPSIYSVYMFNDESRETTEAGFACLIWGWDSPVWYLWVSQFAILFATFALLVRSTRPDLRIGAAGLATVTVGASFLILPGLMYTPLWDAHTVTGFGPGFYLWCASLLLMGTVPLLRGQVRPRQSHRQRTSGRMGA